LIGRDSFGEYQSVKGAKMKSRHIFFYLLMGFMVFACGLGISMQVKALGGETRDYFLLHEKAQMDLDGDGKKETIWVEVEKNNKHKFILHINKQFINGKLHDDIEDFRIINLDTSDKYKEIAVHTSLPSDDDVFNIYWYDGKKIREVIIGLGRWPRFAGNGIVYVRGWMNFWEITNRYLLNKKHTLEETPQEFYHVGLNLKVGKSFPIYTSREEVAKKNGAVIADLRKGSYAQILLWDPKKKLYLIKSESNIIGWTKEENLYRLENLPIAD